MKKVYTKEEQEKINKTMQYIVEDMFKLYDESKIEKLDLDLKNFFYIYKWYLLITKKSIKLIKYEDEDDELGFSVSKIVKTYKLGTRTNKKIKSHSLDTELAIKFIDLYQTIRTKLYNKSKDGQESKDTSMANVDAWYNRFEQETKIEFEIPKTNNQYSVEVKEENGETIGTFHFGDKTINIITRGEFNFIDKRTKEIKKVK